MLAATWDYVASCGNTDILIESLELSACVAAELGDGPRAARLAGACPKPSGTRRARRSINPARPASSGTWLRPGPRSNAADGTPSWPPAARSRGSGRSRS